MRSVRSWSGLIETRYAPFFVGHSVRLHDATHVVQTPRALFRDAVADGVAQRRNGRDDRIGVRVAKGRLQVRQQLSRHRAQHLRHPIRVHLLELQHTLTQTTSGCCVRGLSQA